MTRQELITGVNSILVGQTSFAAEVSSYISLYAHGISKPGQPIGSFMLLGPTGTGKTRAVESLAQMMHGNSRNMLKIDCGEYQMEHEVAKLIGAPPGYLGHRETMPLLSQAKVNGVASEKCDISIILFDEIEKAAGSMTRILLGLLDKAIIRLGDNCTVDFSRCLVFFTSNLGAKESAARSAPIGLPGPVIDLNKVCADATKNAVRAKFSPEFINRIDKQIVFRSLSKKEVNQILDIELDAINDMIRKSRGIRSFKISIDAGARRSILDEGFSSEYGARELNRVIKRRLLVPASDLLDEGLIAPLSTVLFKGSDVRPVGVLKKVKKVA